MVNSTQFTQESRTVNRSLCGQVGAFDAFKQALSGALTLKLQRVLRGNHLGRRATKSEHPGYRCLVESCVIHIGW